MNTNEEVINRITEIRKKNGLSINKLADKCGVNSANLSRSLAGKASLTDRVIYKIANALHVSVDWLEKRYRTDVLSNGCKSIRSWCRNYRLEH